MILELRGGAGGEEAALFAHSLMRMYSMYVQSRGWEWEVLNLNETELGGVKEAVAAAKAYAPFVRKIEVETENLDMVKEAVEAGADIIMLDNMTPEQMAEAIRVIDGRAETECSGNITKENIKTITSLGVDYVSSGALTHSAPILDISLKHLRVLEG